MPQAVAGNVTEPVLIFKLCKEVSDAVRVYRLAVVIDDQIILFEMLVKLLIGKTKSIITPSSVDQSSVTIIQIKRARH